MTNILTGGCQCGAVRFRAEAVLGDGSICHCRMCQKAFGNFFAPLVGVARDKLRWTKAEPKRFRSSNHVQRGFCPECGTPLTYEVDGGDRIDLAIGAFDDPRAVPLIIQYGLEGRLPQMDGINALPARQTMEDVAADAFLASIVSCQHPDHDT